MATEKSDLDHAYSTNSTPPAKAETLSSDSEAGSSHVNERALLRKLDLKLLPPLVLLYLLSFLDRSNVANARIEGLLTDLNFTGEQYLTGLTLYFIGYVIFEIPCNVILKRWTPKLWFPTLTFAWGLVSTLQGVTHNLAGFWAVRFFLGVAEAGLFPGVCYYLSMWYKRQERQYRIALFFSAASLAGAFGGILAYGIGYMRGVGGLNGWRWIFILEGIATCVLAVIAYFFLVNYPDTATFISADERDCIQNRLKADSDATLHEEFSWTNVSTALLDYKCWLYGLAFHTMSLPLYTLSLFLPSIIAALGYTSSSAQLLTIPPYAVATVFTVLWAWGSEKAGRRAPFAIATSSLAIVGYIILLSNKNPTANPGMSYAGVFIVAVGIYPSVALSLSWPANNVSGQTKRACATAMQISIGNLGAVMGTQIYRPAYAPRYIPGHALALGYLVGNVVVNLLLWYLLARENKKRDAQVAQIKASGREEQIEGEWKGDEDVRWRFSY